MDIKVGDHVKIEKAIDKFPIDKIGSIGKVVIMDENYKKELIFGIEFEFKNYLFHNAHYNGKDEQCYYFHMTAYQKLKRKRSRRAMCYTN